jgi:hypothetical protein
MKNQSYFLDAQKAMWCYPELIVSKEPEQEKKEKMVTDDDDSDFNDLETDERVNIDIVRFDNSFPDP